MDRTLDAACDDALDNALAQYSSEEPLTGLEQRVLNRVRAEGAAPRLGFGRWVAAVGVAVVAGMVAAVVWWNRPVPPPPFPGQARRRVPLSNEEQALLALVARAPDQAREALLDLQRRTTEPIQVEAIRIEPLRSDDAK